MDQHGSSQPGPAAGTRKATGESPAWWRESRDRLAPVASSRPGTAFPAIGGECRLIPSVSGVLGFSSWLVQHLPYQMLV